MRRQTILFLLTLLMSMAGAKTYAHDIQVANADGVTIYYVWTNNNKELSVSFRGKNWWDYNEYRDNIVIPETVTYNGKTYSVTSIGEYAFSDCGGMYSITIPYCVTSIGNDAFGNCSGLTSVTIPESVTSIGEEAFRGCTGLTSVTIPNSVTSIESGAFSGCSSLPSITIPESVTSLVGYIFSGCTSLTSVTIPYLVSSIGYHAFSGCTSLTTVTIPDNVTHIAKEAFLSSGLTSITIPYNVTSIGYNAFYCENLTTVISKIERPFAIAGKESNATTFHLNTFNDATLYVPEGTIEKYKAIEGWRDFEHIEEWIEPEPQKCATPSIIFEGGKVSFTCETPDVQYHYEISRSGIIEEDDEVDFTSTYTLKVYASKENYLDSEVASMKIRLSSAGNGDVNGDGKVGIGDIVEITNIMAGKE